jgi:hypothetical protein
MVSMPKGREKKEFILDGCILNPLNASTVEIKMKFGDYIYPESYKILNTGIKLSSI